MCDKKSCRGCAKEFSCEQVCRQCGVNPHLEGLGVCRICAGYAVKRMLFSRDNHRHALRQLRHHMRLVRFGEFAGETAENAEQGIQQKLVYIQEQAEVYVDQLMPNLLPLPLDTSTERLQELLKVYNDEALVYDDSGELVRRHLPNQSEQGVWVHVMNKKFGIQAVKDLMALDAEVCASDPNDWAWGQLYQVHGDLFAVVMSGPAVAVWDHDVWSYVDRTTGRRFRGDCDGGNRVEAWVVPNRCKLVGIISSNEDLADQIARDLKVPVWTSKNGHGYIKTEEQEQEFPAYLFVQEGWV